MVFTLPPENLVVVFPAGYQGIVWLIILVTFNIHLDTQLSRWKVGSALTSGVAPIYKSQSPDGELNIE